MSKSKSTKKPATIRVRTLDENTSAVVLAEYLAIERVDKADIDRVLNKAKANPREIALTFRISEALNIQAPFAMAPRYQLAFERARVVLMLVGEKAAEMRGEVRA